MSRQIMTLNELIENLESIRRKYGGSCEVDVLTETTETGQVEQPLGGTAVAISSRGTSRVKLLPVGFT